MHIGKKIAVQKKPFVSLEFFPPTDPATIPDFLKVVEKLQKTDPLFASVTYGAGGAKQDKTLGVTEKLVSMGLTTMAHLTCVGANKERIEAFLKKLVDVGVENILALRGDMPKDSDIQMPQSDFVHAIDLVHFVKKSQPTMGIGVACYPTPHPESPSYKLDREYTAKKLAEADFGITQLFFDVREYVAMVESFREHGVMNPVIPGILPVQSFTQLKRVLSLSGAAISGKLYLSLEEAASRGTQALQEAGLAFSVHLIEQLLDAGACGIHMYTLNRADSTLEVLSRVGLC